MWTIQPTKDGKPASYGLGFKVERRNGVQIVSHGGSQEETKTHLIIFPEQKSGVVVMCNAARGSAESIATAVVAAIPLLGGR